MESLYQLLCWYHLSTSRLSADDCQEPTAAFIQEAMGPSMLPDTLVYQLSNIFEIVTICLYFLLFKKPFQFFLLQYFHLSIISSMFNTSLWPSQICHPFWLIQSPMPKSKVLSKSLFQSIQQQKNARNWSRNPIHKLQSDFWIWFGQLRLTSHLLNAENLLICWK